MKILIAYDGSDCAKAALDDLRRAGLPAEVEAVVLTAADVFIPPKTIEAGLGTNDVLPDGVRLSWEHNIHQFEEAATLALEAADALKAKFSNWIIRSIARAETAHWAIIGEADGLKPDLVVVGSHGRSALGRLFFGSVSQKVLYETQCSVRIARGREIADNVPIRLVLGTDGSLDASAMLETVKSRKWPTGTQVKLVTAAESFHQYGDEPDAQMDRIREIQVLFGRELREAGLEVISIVKEGDPKQILLQEASSWNADCIFLGAQGHRLFERMMLGSVSSSVAARATCSVEIVRRRI
jgi:nucleotide-binding universal stress UspA family protein